MSSFISHNVVWLSWRTQTSSLTVENTFMLRVSVGGVSTATYHMFQRKEVRDPLHKWLVYIHLMEHISLYLTNTFPLLLSTMNYFNGNELKDGIIYNKLHKSVDSHTVALDYSFLYRHRYLLFRSWFGCLTFCTSFTETTCKVMPLSAQLLAKEINSSDVAGGHFLHWHLVF